MEKLVNYVECDNCGDMLTEGDYADTSGDGHVFCCLQCALDFYGIRSFIPMKKSIETQLNWKQCKESELDEVCMAKRILRETEKNIWRDDENDKAH
jgi:hypothetical protein